MGVLDFEWDQQEAKGLSDRARARRSDYQRTQTNLRPGKSPVSGLPHCHGWLPQHYPRKERGVRDAESSY